MINNKIFAAFLLLMTLGLYGQETIPSISDGVIESHDLFNTTMNESVSCYRIPAIVTAPNGDLLAVIDERVPSCSDLGKNENINIVARRSSDSGKTWSEIENVVVYPTGMSASDPSMIVDKITGEIFLFYNFMDHDNEPGIYYLHMRKSSNNGKSWDQPLDITSQITKPEWRNDFKFITSGRGIQTRSGMLLHTLVNLQKGLFLFGSKNHGKTWSLFETPIKPGDESKVVELADGSWMINSRVKDGGKRYVHTSSDWGRTWISKPEPELIDPGCNASLIRYTSTLDGYNKNRLLFSNANNKHDRKNMTVRISYDEGKTWSPGKTIYSGGSAYSSLTILKNGDIGLLFEKDDHKENAFVRFTLDWLTEGEDSFESPEINNPPDILPNKVIPTEQQIKYQEMELIGFVHFTVNTFTDKEWGYGDESPQVFNPTELNADSWAKAAKEAGLKQLILTAKHHDGFCLWPSKFTEHSVKNSPWKNGEGDLVRDFVDACKKYGLKAGLYLSPWDRNHAEYGNQKYLTYYKNQLNELLTQYGEISEIWFDGANGGDGYYGGANEERRIDRTSYYNWEEVFKFVKGLQPNILIFSDAGPDIRWIGNEKGYAGETNWSMIDDENISIGAADVGYLNSGDPAGVKWMVGECDVSIRPGWFYHEKEDSLVKSPQKLLDIYYKSVGRNGVLLLNIPPDTRGLFHENDIKALKQFKVIIDKTFETNLAKDSKITSSNSRLNNDKFSPKNILDEDNSTYWAADENIITANLEIDLEKEVLFDRIMLQEPVQFGQRISRFSIECFISGQWITIAEGTTIGYKRLLRVQPVTTSKVRLIISRSNNTIAISSFGLYKSTKEEEIKLD